MSNPNTKPEKIVDKNGKLTTVHKKVDSPSTTGRNRASVPAKPAMNHPSGIDDAATRATFREFVINEWNNEDMLDDMTEFATREPATWGTALSSLEQMPDDYLLDFIIEAHVKIEDETGLAKVYADTNKAVAKFRQDFTEYASARENEELADPMDLL